MGGGIHIMGDAKNSEGDRVSQSHRYMKKTGFVRRRVCEFPMKYGLRENLLVIVGGEWGM